MRYYSLDPLADYGRGEFCFTDKLPKGVGLNWYRLAEGVAIAEDYPADASAVTLSLDPVNRGLKPASFLGNTGNLFAVDGATAAVFRAARTTGLEVLPFVLLDHKGRVHSSDCYFLNPLERIPCLNESESTVRRSAKGQLMEIKQLVMSDAALPLARDFFRLGELPSIYLLSETLVEALLRQGCTNLSLKQVPAR